MIDIRQPGSYRYTYSADHEVVARVQPGEQVRIHCVDCFENRLVDESQHYAEVCEYPYLNPQTGPVYVEGAEEGDTLLVHIDDIEITRDWAMTGLVPRFGLLTGTTATAMLTDALPEVVRKVPIRDGRAAARQADEDPDRLSFVHAVRVIRRPVQNPGAFPPADHGKQLARSVLDEILEERVVSAGNRNPVV